MIKVLFVTNTFANVGNGPGLFANLIYDAAKRSSHIDLRILTEDIGSYKTEGIIGLKLEKNKYNAPFYQLIRVLKYYSRAKQIRGYFKYDILVYNNAFNGALSAMRSDVPVVVMINDYERLAFTKQFSFGKSYFKNLTLYYLERKAAQHSSQVIVNSKFMQLKIAKSYGIDRSKVAVLYKGIDIDKYKFRLREALSGSIEVLFVKSNYSIGRLENVIKALGQIHDYKIKLVVIGPAGAQAEKVRNLLEISGLHFELHGKLPNEKVRDFFYRADIFCVPSVIEALGVANMEALASGLPVISTHVGGIPEVLDNGNCGWMVAPDNIQDLTEAILECILDDRQRIAKSLHGREHVRGFNSSNLVPNFIGILEGAINTKLPES